MSLKEKLSNEVKQQELSRLQKIGLNNTAYAHSNLCGKWRTNYAGCVPLTCLAYILKTYNFSYPIMYMLATTVLNNQADELEKLL